jgi:peptidyl-prolyl cis-trans isomerase D
MMIILIIIIAVSLLAYLIPGLSDDNVVVRQSDDVARVGSESVTAREFEDAYTNYIRQSPGQLSKEVLKTFGFDRTILNALIDEQVLISEARRIGLSVSNEEIETFILNNPAFRDNQGKFIGSTLYQQALRQMNLTSDEFEGGLREDMLKSKLRALITASIGVSDKDVEEEFRNRNEKATIDYFVVDPIKMESQVTVNDQEIKDHYEKNKATYNISEKRQGRYLFFDPLKLGDKETVTEAELHQYYDLHQNDFLTSEAVTAQHILFKVDEKKMPPAEVEKIREKALAVLERARKGEDFVQLARQFSEDSTAARGGHLGPPIKKGDMVKEFEKAAFATKPGSISDLVKTENGFHIIKVNDKQNERVRSFAEVKEIEILPVLKKDKGAKKAAELAQQAAAEGLRSKDINVVAQKVGGEIRETPLVERGEPMPALGSEFVTQLFALKQKGDFSSPISAPIGPLVVTLADKQDPHPASLDEVKTRVTSDVKSLKAKDLALQKGNQVQEQIKAGRDLRTVAKAVGVDVKTSPPMTRGASLSEFGSLIDSEKEIFSLPPGKTGTPASSAGRTMAFAVKERKPADPEEMKKAADSIRSELLNRKREGYFAAYREEARKRMNDANEIAIDEKAFEKITATIG